jgi:hypothetical protein
MTVGLWCERFSANFGQAVLAEGTGSGNAPVPTPTKTGNAEGSKETEKTSDGKSVKNGLKSAVVVGVAAVAGGVAMLAV